MHRSRSSKTRKKSAAYARHGKHKTVLGQVRRKEREAAARKARAKVGMTAKIHDLFGGNKRKDPNTRKK